MADLPEDRLGPAPSFTNCADDYFGPFTIKQDRKGVKRYRVLFTVWLPELFIWRPPPHLKEMSLLIVFTDALQWFICRRGAICQLRSDQGTNFVGARHKLKAAVAELDHKRIKKELLKDNCAWFTFMMNVPYSSHMGRV